MLNAKQIIDEDLLLLEHTQGKPAQVGYDLSFDTEQLPSDTLAEDKGVKILVDMKSLLYLYGTELEFSGGLNGKGFQWENPNASRTCGCGESFSL